MKEFSSYPGAKGFEAAEPWIKVGWYKTQIPLANWRKIPSSISLLDTYILAFTLKLELWIDNWVLQLKFQARPGRPGEAPIAC